MKKIIYTSIISLICGCEIFNPSITYPESDSTISAVLVIIENSYIGYNKGAVSDMVMMTNMLSGVTDDIVILKDGYATRKNVKEAITRACSNELAIVFFSCHGGHERANRKDSAFEKDGYDEYVYLSESSITDNELWDIFKNSTNRIFTIFNCCRSGTMFRTSSDTDNAFVPFSSTSVSDNNPRLLSWSACGDDSFAVTSREGGEFVKSIYRSFNAFNGIGTYNQIWTAINTSRDLRKFQKPEVNVIGNYAEFEDVMMFR